FRIVERVKPAQQAEPPFQSREIVSAGPDGQFGTADDVRSTSDDYWQTPGTWWVADDPTQRIRKTGRRPQPQQLALQRTARDLNFGGFQGAGMPGQARGDRHLAAPPAMRDLGLLAAAPPAPGMHVREYFPETLLWQPNLVTDENGVADLAVNLADSITTWRL